MFKEKNSRRSNRLSRFSIDWKIIFLDKLKKSLLFAVKCKYKKNVKNCFRSLRDDKLCGDFGMWKDRCRETI
jgi:hypothetical protein